MLNESHMPGPSEAAQKLQLKQFTAYEALFDALAEIRDQNPGISHQAAYAHPGYLAQLAVYDGLVTQLEALLGPTAHCNEVDCDLWTVFSDVFKSENGFRPRGMHYTRADVQKRLAA